MPAIAPSESPLKQRLRTWLGEGSLAWRSLHGLNLGFQLALPPRLEPSLSVEAWLAAGRPAPPPHSVKERIVSEYAAACSIRVFIETGTYRGDMVRAALDRFDRIYSIELSEALSRRARWRFRAFPKVRILQGDSGEVLAPLLTGISTRCLFWLDGHSSSGITARGETATPAMAELATILDHPVPDHVILIDDARLFDGAHGFPALSELRDLLGERRPGWEMRVRNDVVRIHGGPDLDSQF